jgi:glutathione S-transferase
VNAGPSSQLRLHGYPVSNYFNIARAALLEKGADFAIVIVRASSDPAFLKVSPMGKIPMLETPQGTIAETVAILEYIEDTLPRPALYSEDAFVRARARQIINVVQMYVEAPVRTLFPGVFQGRANPDAVVASARQTLERASRALRILVAPDPFLSGRALSLADLFAFYCLDIADRVTRQVYSRSLLEDIGGLQDWTAAMAARQSSRLVSADFYPAFDAYLKSHSAGYDCYRDIAHVLPPPAAPAA